MKKEIEYLGSDEYELFSDLGLCSTLYHLKFPVVAINRDPKEYPKVEFVFKRTAKLEEAVRNYFNGALFVEPRGLWNASRDLKGRIYASR